MPICSRLPLQATSSALLSYYIPASRLSSLALFRHCKILTGVPAYIRRHAHSIEVIGFTSSTPSQCRTFTPSAPSGEINFLSFQTYFGFHRARGWNSRENRIHRPSRLLSFFQEPRWLIIALNWTCCTRSSSYCRRGEKNFQKIFVILERKVVWWKITLMYYIHGGTYE